MPEDNKGNLKQRGGIWLKRSDKAGQYLVLAINAPRDLKAGEKIYLTAFRNKEKEKDTEPDYKVYVNTRQKKKK